MAKGRMRGRSLLGGPFCTAFDAPLTQAVSKAYPRCESAASLAQLPRKLLKLAPPWHGHNTLEGIFVGARWLDASLAELAEPDTRCPRRRILLNENAIRTP